MNLPENRVENTSNSLQTAYLITNHHLLIFEVSEQVGGWLAPDTKTLIGESLPSLIPELVPQAAQLSQVALNQAPALQLGRIRRPNNNDFDNYFTVQVQALNVKPQHLLVIITNITYLVQLEQNHQYQRKLEASNRQLQQQNEDMAKFASIISHDLQSPLRTISNFLKLLTEQYSDQLDETAHLYVDYVVGGANHMQALIRDLVAYTRLKIKHQPWPATSVETLLNRVCDGFGFTTHLDGATITYHNLPEIQADPDLLYQLFQQIIDNALKFRAEQPPQIQVTTKRIDHPTGWQFSIQDNGIGFDPKFAEEIFQVFRQLHPANTYPGTGIGLALCKKIVVFHGGQIWAESTPGQGTSIYFTLPDIAY